MSPRLGIIGLGEAGSTMCSTLARDDVVVHGYDVRLDLESFRRSLEGHLPVEINLVGSLKELVEVSDYVFSLVTADAALDAARSASGFMDSAKTFLDGNSVSPRASRAIASILAERGCRFVDLALMAPVANRGHRIPMLVSGHGAASVAESLEPLGFDMKVIGAEPGIASAAKMVRSVVLKGVEALLTESLAASSVYGVTEHVLDSLDQSFPDGTWRERADYFARRTANHATRRAAEMELAAEAISDAGIDPLLAEAAAKRLFHAATVIQSQAEDVFDHKGLSALVASGAKHA